MSELKEPETEPAAAPAAAEPAVPTAEAPTAEAPTAEAPKPEPAPGPAASVDPPLASGSASTDPAPETSAQSSAEVPGSGANIALSDVNAQQMQAGGDILIGANKQIYNFNVTASDESIRLLALGPSLPDALKTSFDRGDCDTARRAYGAGLTTLRAALVGKRWIHLDMASHDAAFALTGCLLEPTPPVREIHLRPEHRVGRPDKLLAIKGVTPGTLLFVKAGDGDLEPPGDGAGRNALTESLNAAGCWMVISTIGMRREKADGPRDPSGFLMARRFPGAEDVPARVEALRRDLPDPSILRDVARLEAALRSVETPEELAAALIGATEAAAAVRPDQPDAEAREAVLTVLSYLGAHFGDLDLHRFNLLADRLCARLDETAPIEPADRPRFGLLRGGRGMTRAALLIRERDALFQAARLVVRHDPEAGSELASMEHQSVREQVERRLADRPNLRWQIADAVSDLVAGSKGFASDDRLDGLAGHVLAQAFISYGDAVRPRLVSWVRQRPEAAVGRLEVLVTRLRAAGAETALARLGEELLSTRAGAFTVARFYMTPGPSDEIRHPEWLKRAIEQPPKDPGDAYLNILEYILGESARKWPDRLPALIHLLLGWVEADGFGQPAGRFAAMLLWKLLNQAVLSIDQERQELGDPLLALLIADEGDIAGRLLRMWCDMPADAYPVTEEGALWTYLKAVWHHVRHGGRPPERGGEREAVGALDAAFRLGQLLAFATLIKDEGEPHPSVRLAAVFGKATRSVFRHERQRRERQDFVVSIGRIVESRRKQCLAAGLAKGQQPHRIGTRLDRVMAKLRLA